MLSEVGTLLIGLGLAVALYAAAATLWGLTHEDSRWLQSGKNATDTVPALTGSALLLLALAFLNDRFEIAYVAQHAARALPLSLKLSALWAGQEGSLLLWSFLQALFAALATRHPAKLEVAAPEASRSNALPLPAPETGAGSIGEKTAPNVTETVSHLIPWATVSLSLITAFFIAVTLGFSNPFALSFTVPADGMGLNPLLRHAGMIFHPPAMYVGYVGVAVPFAFALAALVTGRVESWTAAVRSWALVAWIGLGLGLLLGMRWAYDVLGWGGYWGWDPVENAGLMPWLTMTAFLHGAVLQDERRGFQGWSFALIIASFVLVLFGTFATRSGLIQSVHAYARSNLGTPFMAAIVVTLVGSLALLLWRRGALAPTPAHTPSPALLSREGMFFLTLVLFGTLTLSVFVGSVLPTLTSWIGSHSFEAGPAWFDRVTGPQFAALLLLLGLCPLVGRSATLLQRLQSRGWPIFAGTTLVIGATALAGFTQPAALIGIGLVGLAGSTALLEYTLAIKARRDNTGESPFRALGELLQRQPRKYAGYLVHIGVALIGVGIIGTRLYPLEQDIVLTWGETTKVGDYTLLLENMQQESADDSLGTWANVDLYRNGRYVSTLMPRINRYRALEQSIGVPALQPGLREDLYLILAGWSNDGSEATFKVILNPLANFLWLGGLVFLAGGALTLWPMKASHAASQQKTQRAVRLLAAFALLVGAGWTMWGLPHGTARRDTARPIPGSPAPSFELPLLDGSGSLTAPPEEITVVSFWAPWCATCQKSLPAMRSVWEAYHDRSVTFVGIAYQSNEAEVRAAVAEYGIPYPVGLDHEDALANRYGITGVPESFVIDTQGRVAFLHVGPVSAERLAQELETLLGGETP